MKMTITCSVCQQKSLQLLTTVYATEVKHDGRSYHVSLPQLTYYQCSICRTVILPDQADIEVGLELRRVANLLLPSEILAGRTRLGWSQKQLAELLNVAEATVSRWESGGQIQPHGYDRTLRAVFGNAGVRQEFEVLAGWTQPGQSAALPAPRDSIS
jgi:DNA-binding transcriptional regulator YiaG